MRIAAFETFIDQRANFSLETGRTPQFVKLPSD